MRGAGEGGVKEKGEGKQKDNVKRKERKLLATSKIGSGWGRRGSEGNRDEETTIGTTMVTAE